MGLEIPGIIIGGLTIILTMRRLRRFKKNFNVVEAVCISYGRGGSGHGIVYYGTYEYYVDGIKYTESHGTPGSFKPRLNEKCYVYVSKDEPKNIVPYSERKYSIRMLILGLTILIGPLILDVLSLSIRGFW